MRVGGATARRLVAKFPGLCRKCGSQINPGDPIWWTPGERAACEPCGQNGSEPSESDGTAKVVEHASRAWTAQQEAIFGWFATGTGHLVVRARAGTGKTSTILEAIRHAPEHDVLLAAFNKRIAQELQGRLAGRAGACAKTLHALGYQALRKARPEVTVDGKRGKRIVDGLRANRWTMPGGALLCLPSSDPAPEGAAPGEQDMQLPENVAREVARWASVAKNVCPLALNAGDVVDGLCDSPAIEFPDEETELRGWTAYAHAALAFAAMQAAQADDGTCDYDDMLYLPLALGMPCERYSLVVVDEAQDMCPAQLLLARKALREGGRMVLVGDDRQAIYGFRGADSNALDRMRRELQAAELGLTVTWRCPRLVVERAARLVPDYSAAPEAPEGELAEGMLPDLIAGATPGDFVLSRTNAPLGAVALALLRAGKRAGIAGRDLGAGLLELVRRWKVSSVPAWLARLRTWEDREVKRARASRSESRAEEVMDRAALLRELAQDVAGLRELETRIETLFAEDGRPRIVCSSVHRAKGLEADRVWLLEETLHRGRDAQEESNIEYVAVTRAKRVLWSIFGVGGRRP